MAEATWCAATLLARVRELPADRTARAMARNFAAIGALLALLRCGLTRRARDRGGWLADASCARGQKRATERWFLAYSAVWIGAFAVIIGGGLYERFDRLHYLLVCGGLDAPLLLQARRARSPRSLPATPSGMRSSGALSLSLGARPRSSRCSRRA